MNAFSSSQLVDVSGAIGNRKIMREVLKILTIYEINIIDEHACSNDIHFS